MNRIIKNVLDKLENKGYEAYIIGGYVRDLLVGKNSYDIDICTNATPRELLGTFPNSSSKNLGGISFKIKEYHFEITTYREEIKYENRRPIKYNYIDNLLLDLQRRDFTINAICMNKKGEIIDLINGTKDIQDNKIRMIGNPTTKIKEDPLRILRGIRIATVLNFNLESSLYKVIKSNNEEVLKLSNTRIKEEMDKILLSNYPKRGLNLLNELGISKLLGITDYEELVPLKSLEGIYAQIKINYKLPFTRIEKNNISNLKKILKENTITKKTIYQYGLYLCLTASEIINIKQSYINKMYKELAIHDRSEIDIKAEDLIKLGLKNQNISKVFKHIEDLIIEDKLKNKKNEIIKYLSNKIK